MKRKAIFGSSFVSLALLFIHITTIRAYLNPASHFPLKSMDKGDVQLYGSFDRLARFRSRSASPTLTSAEAQQVDSGNTNNSKPSNSVVGLDEDIEIELPRPLTSVQRSIRAATFWSKMAPILLNYNKLKQSIKSNEDPRSSRYKALSEQEVGQLWEDAHNYGADILSSTIQEMKGFYVKTGQVISTRVDLFPQQYIDKLQVLQDSIDPIPTALVKAIISKELLEGEPLSKLFSSFDEEPLGSASIAQVHRAVLLDGREVAVKVQRPSEEPKLRGDIANLKAITKTFRDSLPVDYYTVFCELEKALANELDFLVEAQSMQKIAASISHTCDGKPAKAPLIIPAPIQGLCTDRVLIMDFINGIPLNKLGAKMKDRKVEEGSPEAILFANKLLTSLTEAFARMIFGPGFIHGDPHPGNIFITEEGDISLIDCGQVKQIPSIQKRRIAELVLYIDEYSTLSKEIYGDTQMTDNNYQDEVRAMFQGNDDNTFSSDINTNGKVKTISDSTSTNNLNSEIISSNNRLNKAEESLKVQQERLEEIQELISAKVKEFGVTFEDGVVYKDAAVAVAMLLFAEKGIVLPGGYSGEELSPNSPLRCISSFPQELVMLGRATVLCKGIASKLQVRWNIANKFAPAAKQCIELLDEKQGNVLPIYAKDNSNTVKQRNMAADSKKGSSGKVEDSIERNRVKFYEVKTLFFEWAMGKVFSTAPRRVKQYLLKREARKIQKAAEEN